MPGANKPHRPTPYCADIHCYFHDIDEPGPAEKVCFECGHRYRIAPATNHCPQCAHDW